MTSLEWKKTDYRTQSFMNGVLDTTYVDTVYQNVERLKFNDDQTVVYRYPLFIDPINGNWAYDQATQTLTTTLKKELSSSTGLGTRYFFPQTKTIQLTGELLQLQSDTIYTYFGTASGMFVNARVTDYYFHH